MAAAKKQCFLRFLYCTECSPTVIQSPRFTNDYKFSITRAKIVKVLSQILRHLLDNRFFNNVPLKLTKISDDYFKIKE